MSSDSGLTDEQIPIYFMMHLKVFRIQLICYTKFRNNAKKKKKKKVYLIFLFTPFPKFTAMYSVPLIFIILASTDFKPTQPGSFC